jgi:opacity protein-like surface antigen
MTGIGSGTATETYNVEGKPYTTHPYNISGVYQLSTIGQVEIGYDYHFKNSGLVIGVFGDVGFGSGTSEITYSIDGRVGFALGNALIYGFGGWEKAHLVHEMTYIDTNELAAKLKADPDGFVYGLGVDVALGRGWYAGVRYERVDYGKVTAKGSANNVDYVASVSGTDDRGLLTLGYKF